MTTTFITPWLNDVDTDVPSMQGVNRGIGYLSTGEIIHVVHWNNDLHIYRTDPDTVVHTLITSAIPSSDHGNFTSLHVDASDNIHLVYRNSSDDILYVKLTKGGGLTWTVGSAETVRTYNATSAILGRTDVEVLDSGAILVAWNEVDATDADAKIGKFMCRVRHSGGVWATASGVNMAPTGGVLVGGMCSVARDLAGATANVQVVAYAYNLKGNGLIPTFGTMSVNVATGAISGRTDRLQFGHGNIRHYGHLYSTANETWVFVGQSNHATGTNLCETQYFKYNLTNGFVERANPLAQLDSTFPNLEDSYPTTALVGDTGVLVTSFTIGGETTTNVRCYHPGVGWGPQFVFQRGKTDAASTGVGMEFMRSSANRNRPTTRFDMMATHSASWKGAGSHGRAHYYYRNRPPAPPISIYPGITSSAATVLPTIVSTDRPVLRSLTAALAGGNERRRLRWQIDPTGAFSGGESTVQQPVSALQFAGLGAHTMQVDAPNELEQGDFAIRAATIDEFGRVGSYLSGYAFWVRHPPSVGNHAPTSGAARNFGAGSVTLSWGFLDPSPYDAQTAYQAVLMLNDDAGTVIADSGKLTDTDQFHTFTGLSSALKDVELKWAVVVWDSDDVSSGNITEASTHVFMLGDQPTVVIDSPATGSTVDAPMMGVSWTPTFSAGRTQRSYKVTIGDGINVLYDTGWVVSTDTSTTIPFGILESGEDYYVAVQVTDTAGLVGADLNTFSTLWLAPNAPAFAVDTSTYETDGYVTIRWTNSSIDDDFISYRVYVRGLDVDDSSEWRLAGEYTDDIANYEHHEYLIGANQPWEYKVVQVADRFGAQVESVTEGYIDTAEGTYYWLIGVSDDTTVAYRLHNVTADDPTEEWDQEFVQVIGRGRLEDRGTRWGWSGSLTAQLRDKPDGLTARLQRQQINGLKEVVVKVYVRNPFGDLILSGIGGISMSRVAGVGVREFVDITIPYVELEGAV